MRPITIGTVLGLVLLPGLVRGEERGSTTGWDSQNRGRLTRPTARATNTGRRQPAPDGALQIDPPVSQDNERPAGGHSDRSGDRRTRPATVRTVAKGQSEDEEGSETPETQAAADDSSVEDDAEGGIVVASDEGETAYAEDNVEAADFEGSPDNEPGGVIPSVHSRRLDGNGTERGGASAISSGLQYPGASQTTGSDNPGPPEEDDAHGDARANLASGAAPIPLAPRGETKAGTRANAVSPSNGFGAVALSLGVVLAAFFGVVWLMRRGMPKSAATLPTDVVEILGKAPLAGRQSLHLIRFGQKLVLASIGEGLASSISEIDDPDEAARLAGLCRSVHPESASASFKGALAQLGKERGRSLFSSIAKPETGPSADVPRTGSLFKQEPGRA